MRGGPGLGNIAPSQSDYFQATKGGGHGDYHCIVLAPSTVQESFNIMFDSFDLADKYRNPVLVLTDGMLGQMMEPLETRYAIRHRQYVKKWALTGCAGRKPGIIRSLYLAEGALEKINLNIQKKYRIILDEEQRWEEFLTDDARIILVAYGTMARIAKSAVKQLRAKGKKVGLIRPVTLWPFPDKAFAPYAVPASPAGRRRRRHAKSTTFLVTEMSYGQMVEDVRLALDGKAKVEFLGRAGGGIPSEEEIISKVRRLVR
jgi:2-oxoglutarate ferredoxin oxidoreductase subunit alpha